MLQERNVEERGKFHYYMAKVYAKDGRTDLSLQYLRKALEEGFKDRKKIEEDPELAPLRDIARIQGTDGAGAACIIERAGCGEHPPR